MQVTSVVGRPTLFRLLAVVSLVLTAGCSGGSGTSPSGTPLPPPPLPSCFQTADFGCAQETEYRRLQAEYSAPYAEETAFQNQWGLDAINAARAFANVELAEGAGTVPGAGVTVGFVDTGIDLDHPVFTGSVTEEFLLSAVDETGTEFSHGTAVASIVGADFLGLAPEVRHHGFRGVAPGADLKMFAIPLSSGDRPYRPISLIGLAGVDREFQEIANALRAGGVDVVNLSFGYRGIIDDYSEADLRAALGDAIAAMAQADAAEKTIQVWAAGNDHNEDCTAGTDHCVGGGDRRGIARDPGGAPRPDPGAPRPRRRRRGGWPGQRRGRLPGHRVLLQPLRHRGRLVHRRPPRGCGDHHLREGQWRCGSTRDQFGERHVVRAPMVAGGLAVMKQLFRGQLGSEELVGRLYKPGAGPRPAVIRPNPKRIGRMRYRRSRMAIAMRRSGPRMTSRTGGDARPRGDDDPCMALAPTTPRRRLTPKIPERAAQGAAGTLRINDASDVRPKACPGGSEA